MTIPPSLINIYKELQTDIQGFKIPKHGCLKSWADQGVLLLNTVLTVEAGRARSHSKLGWTIFTDYVITLLSNNRTGIIFLLWGADAQKKDKIINSQYHRVLKAPHPSPRSAYRGFLGCHHFSQTNILLVEQNIYPIDWQPRLSDNNNK